MSAIMKKVISIIILILGFSSGNALLSQTLQTTHMCNLAGEISETSGLVWIDGELWTHNDSGGGAALFQIDTITGAVLRTVSITNAQNRDWEDISIDDEYVYIGDFGNNNGNRTDLTIYRISKDFIYLDFDEITADSILFHYPNQTQFEWDNYTTNFDCEAMIATSDSLYLFSKNWGNHKSYLYSLPKTPGNYAANLRDSLDVNGLVTGAVYDPQENKVLLIGYAPYLSSSFVHLLNNYQENNFFSGSETQINISLILHQVEGIEWLRETEFILSFETFNTVNAGLRRADLSNLTDILNEVNQKSQPTIFPNPANKKICIENCVLYDEIRIYDLTGKLVFEREIESSEVEINVQCFKAGTYSIEFLSPYRKYSDLIIIN